MDIKKEIIINIKDENPDMFGNSVGEVLRTLKLLKPEGSKDKGVGIWLMETWRYLYKI